MPTTPHALTGKTNGAMTRRTLIRRAGAAAAGAYAAHELAATSALAASEPSSRAWRALAADLNGRLIRPGDRDYPRLSLPWNRRYATVHPAGIVRCATERDAQTAVLWAREHDLPLAARSGGHNYAGYSTTRGLLVDMGGMRYVSVDDDAGTFTATPGARNTDIYDALEPHQVAISAGRCPTVAIGGLVLGGGFGFSSRALGLTCDSLLETRIVTADGRLVTCNQGENTDLFWALRGAGGGNFGINTYYRFATSPVVDVGLFDLQWDGEHTAKVMAALQDMMRDAPDRMSCRMGTGTDGRSAPALNALGQLFGPVSELEELLGPVLAAARPRKRLIAQRTFWQAKEHFYLNTPVDRFVVRSRFVHDALTEEAIDVIARGVARYPGSRNRDGGGVAMYAWGGQISRIPAGATAFVHREPGWLLAYDASWTARDTPSTVRRNLDWLEEFGSQLDPFVSREAYQNFIDRSQPDWRAAYYGDAYGRLAQVKRVVDPDRVFDFQQAI